jgi:hypothetical protein
VGCADICLQILLNFVDTHLFLMKSDNNEPNVVVEWLTLPLRTWEVPAILTEAFCGFPQSLQANSLSFDAV